MSLSSIELWQRIAAEGLASPMQCRTWAAEAAKSMPAEDTTDGIKVLQQLIGAEKLTNYQAKILAGQSQKPLRRGAWFVRRHVKSLPFVGWLEVAKVDLTKAEQPPPRWAKWLTGEELTELRASAPALPRGIQLAGIAAEHLQAVEMPELSKQANEGSQAQGAGNPIASELQLLVAPVRGQLLSAPLVSPKAAFKPLPIADAMKIIEQVASGLSAMHAAGAVHGRVFPDRIAVHEGHATLIRDPISALTATLDEHATGVLGAHLGGSQAAALRTEHFLAPEFIAPGQLPTLATDVFALGAVWWWLITGEPPAGAALGQGAKRQAILSAAAGPLPSLPGNVVLPEPLLRVLQHTLARNAKARFANAADLSAALRQAREVIQVGKQAVAPKPVAPKPVAPKSVVPKSVVPKSMDAQQRSKDQSRPLPRERSGEPQSRAAKAELAPAKPAKPAAATPKQAMYEKTTSEKIASEKIASEKTAAKHANTMQRPKTQASAVAAESAPTPTKPAALAKPAALTKSAAESREPSVAPKATRAEPVKADSAAAIQSTAPAAKGTAVRASKGATTAPSPLRRRKRAKNKWLLPVVGGCGFLIVALLALKFSGALDSMAQPSVADNRVSGDNRPPLPVEPPTVVAKDPREEYYNIVASSGGELWAPPSAPRPLAIDLLPPGSQMFVAWRPASWLASEAPREVLSAFDSQLDGWFQSITGRAGVPLESIEQMTIAFYSASVALPAGSGATPTAPNTFGAPPATVLRVELEGSGRSLSELKQAWGNPEELKIGNETLLASSTGNAYYIASQPKVGAQMVTQFSVGPLALQREVAELEGGAGPMISQMETLWQASDASASISVLVYPPFLFADGRSLLDNGPVRLKAAVRGLIGNNARAAMIQSHIAENWYFETQIIGGSTQEAGGIADLLRRQTTALPAVVENWFVEQSPHPYWRALAFRFPQMLRSVAEYARFGVEDGVAIGNVYLPPEASTNVLLASWIALQDGATLSGLGMAGGEPVVGNSGAGSAAGSAPMSIDAYLARPIKVVFAQEPIERALAMIGEEANDGLPPGTPALRFELDGGAFERAGITRNQQLRNFANDNLPIRDALTTVAKLGNPVTTVTDLSEADQKLIWVVQDDPQNPGQSMISLTTRDAATSASVPLPAEFQ